MVDTEKNINKVQIEEVEELYSYSNDLKSIVLHYDGNSNGKIIEENEGEARRNEIVEEDELSSSTVEGLDRND